MTITTQAASPEPLVGLHAHIHKRGMRKRADRAVACIVLPQMAEILGSLGNCCAEFPTVNNRDWCFLQRHRGGCGGRCRSRPMFSAVP